MNRKHLLLMLLFPLLKPAAFDVDLNGAGILALEASKQIKNSQARLELAVMNHDFEFRNFLPSIDINYSDNRQVTQYSPDSDNLQLGLNISQPFFNGGRTLKAHELTKVKLSIQAAVIEQQKEEVQDKIWQLFFNLILNREKLSLQKELLEVSVKHLSITLKKHDLGLLTELDYLEAAVEVQNMELSILETENRDRSLREEFALIMGLEPDFFKNEPLNLEGNIDREYQGLPLWKEDQLCYEELALQENPDLYKKRADLNQLKAEFDIAHSSWIPRLSLESSFFVRGSRFPLQQPGFMFSLKIDFPCKMLPSGFSIGGGVQSSLQDSSSLSVKSSILPDITFMTDEKSASLKLIQAEEALLDSITDIGRVILSSLETLEHMRLSMNLRRKTQALLSKRLRLIESRNLLGEVTELELLEARIDFFEQEIIIREAVLNILKAERDFEKLLGLGLGELAELSEIINREAFSVR